MTNTLTQICAAKRQHIAQCKTQIPLNKLLRDISAQNLVPRGFAAALRQQVQQKQTGLIAEIKKASPSKGLIRANFNPQEIAKSYEEAGATCISVLTDAPYFQGKNEYLQQAYQASKLPILRKDFMLDEYQIVEAKALGADCILLIMAALDDNQAADLEAAALELKMDVLLEIHNEQELERALRLQSKLLGINNRNLKTLQIDLTTTKRLLPLIKNSTNEYVIVCESGISCNADIQDMQQMGIYCFLVGESLMRQTDIVSATKNLIGYNV